MNKRIAAIFATMEEAALFVDYLQKEAVQHTFQSFQLHQLQVDVLYTGIGVMQTTYSLMEYISHRHPDAWIQAGIGGAYDKSLSIPGVYHITSEMLVGIGAQQQDGSIKDPFQMGWMDPDGFPYENGKLNCLFKPKWSLPEASGMTTFYSHGQESAIGLLAKNPTGQIENMEGAPFFYISLIKKIPFLSLRSISNHVAPRNVSDWKIKEAIATLSSTLTAWLEDNEFNVDKMFGIGSKQP